MLTDVVFMQAVGMRPIVVHGGEGDHGCDEEGGVAERNVVQGRRYTDQRTLAIAEHVLCNDINGFIVSTINVLGEGDAADEFDEHGVVCGEDVFGGGRMGGRLILGKVGAGDVGEWAAVAGVV